MGAMEQTFTFRFFSDYKRRFNLKGDLEVSKSAEDYESSQVKMSKKVQFYSGVVVGLEHSWLYGLISATMSETKGSYSLSAR